jgi:hypothetical protein
MNKLWLPRNNKKGSARTLPFSIPYVYKIIVALFSSKIKNLVKKFVVTI